MNNLTCGNIYIGGFVKAVFAHKTIMLIDSLDSDREYLLKFCYEHYVAMDILTKDKEVLIEENLFYIMQDIINMRCRYRIMD